ncbi:MAG: hypothetical protein ROY82_01845 [Truepera sp.]|jgi:hypothetical protein|nr:hypothetical protein [Truepera sp.]
MTLTLTDLLSEKPDIPWCYTCQGDGYLVYVGGPGYYSTYHGNYLPTERQEPCDDCHGTGRNDDGSSPTNAVRQHLRALTPSQRLHLQRLTQGHKLPVTPANYQALEDLLSEVENELSSKHPITVELEAALNNAQLLEPTTPPTGHRRPRIY